jgi:hypothetical protein
LEGITTVVTIDVGEFVNLREEGARTRRRIAMATGMAAFMMTIGSKGVEIEAEKDMEMIGIVMREEIETTVVEDLIIVNLCLSSPTRMVRTTLIKCLLECQTRITRLGELAFELKWR